MIYKLIFHSKVDTDPVPRIFINSCNHQWPLRIQNSLHVCNLFNLHFDATGERKEPVFEWGSDTLGTRQLSIAILLELVGVYNALRFGISFMNDFLISQNQSEFFTISFDSFRWLLRQSILNEMHGRDVINDRK